jgi:type VI secretion system protein ImpL
MKQHVKKILKIFLVATLILLAVLLVFGVALGMGWPWWAALFILTGLFGLVLGLVFFKKVWIRRREQRFVNQVIEQDNSYLKSLGDQEKQSSKELQERWKEAMNALRKSHLKKHGNPLYVLPWYMVFGESGSGKTTAISSARLSSPFAEISRTSGISGTRNCDWWFFEQAVLIDTAGRYAIPIDEGRDKDEWRKFLSLLTKFRKKEPLNGLVLTIAADKLVDSGPDSLEESGRSIRQRIDELMRTLGAKFPVYVLVTKCDLIHGMTEFYDRISEKGHQQAMGALNHDLSKDIAEFTGRTLHSIGERLKDFRLLLLHKPDSKDAEPGLLVFPEEFNKLSPGLDAFVRGAFQENPYQETPILRGLFFSSGKQEGSPYSHFLKELGLIEEKEVLPGTDKGLFLHDLFSKILPSDRGLFAPTQRTLEWSRLTRNMGLTSWVAICVAACGLLSLSFVKNLKTIRDVSHQFSKPPVLQGEILTDTIIMDRFREALLKVEKQNQSWWVPRLGLSESRNVEVTLKDAYCKKFRDEFLVSFDKQMAGTMTRFSAATSKDVFGKYAAHLVKRINLIRARIESEDPKKLQSRSQPPFDTFLLGADQNLIPEVSKKVAQLYLYFLIWRQDKTGLNLEMKTLQTWLKHILTIKGATLNWIVDQVDSDPSLSPVTLADFWGDRLEKTDSMRVPPAFSIQGKKQIDIFLKEIESALYDPLIIAGQKLEFEKWYPQAYIQTWHDFSAVFPKGAENLGGKEAWEAVAARMGSDKNPYFALFEMMAQELEPFSGAVKRPAWINVVYDFKFAKLQAQITKKDDTKKVGLFKKTTKKVASTLKKAERAVGAKAEGTLDNESGLIAGKAFLDYQTALAEIVPVSSSRNAAYNMAVTLYSEDPTASQSPFFKSYRAAKELKRTMIDPGQDLKVMEKLITGPVEFLHEFVSRETACHLQSQWEKEVLMEVQQVSDQKDMHQLLMGDDGFAIQFINGPAKPFITRSLIKGYYAKKVTGRNIPFNEYFLAFLTKGTKTARPIKEMYGVTIRAYPTGANKEARIRPHETSLELQCTTETSKLINLNYPVKKTFNWSPQNCGDVIFKINVGNVVLVKKYSGYQAFPKFIRDFNKGQRTFYSRDFPDKRQALKRMGIKFITVKYQFRGHRPVLSLLRSAPGRIPRTVAKCWD